jgi:hypothetical protein
MHHGKCGGKALVAAEISGLQGKQHVPLGISDRLENGDARRDFRADQEGRNAKPVDGST